jgi:hypothetical protein
VERPLHGPRDSPHRFDPELISNGNIRYLRFVVVVVVVVVVVGLFV